MRLRLAPPLSMCREGVKAGKKNDMTIFVIEERSSEHSLGVRQRADGHRKTSRGSFQNR